MKKAFLISIIILVCNSVNAQFSMSAKAGVNFNNLHHAGLADSTTKLYSIASPSFSLKANYQVHLFTFGIEESYFKWGYKYDEITFTDVAGNDLGKGSLYHYNYSALTALTAGIIFGDRIKLSPAIGISLLKSFSEKQGQSVTINGINESKVNDYYNSIFLFTAGATLYYPLSPHLNVDISGIYGHSISKVYYPESGWWMNDVQLLAGVSYVFGHKSEK